MTLRAQVAANFTKTAEEKKKGLSTAAKIGLTAATVGAALGGRKLYKHLKYRTKPYKSRVEFTSRPYRSRGAPTPPPPAKSRVKSALGKGRKAADKGIAAGLARLRNI